MTKKVRKFSSGLKNISMNWHRAKQSAINEMANLEVVLAQMGQYDKKTVKNFAIIKSLLADISAAVDESEAAYGHGLEAREEAEDARHDLANALTMALNPAHMGDSNVFLDLVDNMPEEIIAKAFDQMTPHTAAKIHRIIETYQKGKQNE